MAFELKKLNTCQLVELLMNSEVPQVVCDSIKDNDIDGTTLTYLMSDRDEFVAVVPKASHRLHLKNAVEKAKNQPTEIAVQPSLEDDFGFARDLVNKVNLVSMQSCNSSGMSGMEVFSCPLSSTPDKECLSQPETMSISPVPPAEIIEGTNEIRCSNDSTRDKKNFSTPKSIDPSKGLPANLPFPSKFSLRVETAIESGNVLRVRRQLIADIGMFYIGICPNPQQGDYKRIAVMICEKFPELKDSSASRFWVSVQKQLSQFFRNQRRYSKLCETSSKENSEKNVPVAKRARISANEVDDVLTQKRNLELLRDCNEKDLSEQTYDTLIKDTFKQRRKFVTSEAKSSSEILELCPYLGRSENVRKETQQIMHGFSFKKSVERLTNGIKNLLKKHCQEITSQEVIQAVRLIEKKTAKKGSSVLKFKDPSTKPDQVFKDKMVEFCLVCLGTPQDIEQVFVAGEDRCFFETSTNLVEALVDLILTYYVFDVSYADSMAGVFYFLQEVALEIKDDIPKPIKYSSFMAELRSGVHTA